MRSLDVRRALSLTFKAARSHFHTMPSELAQESVDSAFVDSSENPSKRKPITFPHRFVMAPMVGQSDLAFRLLCLQLGASAVYTEMFYSDRIVNEPGYLRESLQSCAEDSPLIVQICGNEPTTMAAAAAAVEQFCNSELFGVDAIDINLGCPQKRAQEQLFGSYLLDKRHWPRVESIVSSMNAAVSVPISCKIRLLQTAAQTVELARRLEAAGASMLVVHGRQRGSQRHGRKGPADLHAVAAVKQAVSIPVIANGNVRGPGDVIENVTRFAVDGVMSAEGLLANPALFAQAREIERGRTPTPNATKQAALDYLSLAERYSVPFDVQRQHIAHVIGASPSTVNASWHLRKQAAQHTPRQSPPSPPPSSVAAHDHPEVATVIQVQVGPPSHGLSQATTSDSCSGTSSQRHRGGETVTQPPGHAGGALETPARAASGSDSDSELARGSPGPQASGGRDPPRRLWEIKHALAAASSPSDLSLLIHQLLPWH